MDDPFGVEATVPVVWTDRCDSCKKRFECWTNNGFPLKLLSYKIESCPNSHVLRTMDGQTQILHGLSDDEFNAEFSLDGINCVSLEDIGKAITDQDFVKFKGRHTIVTRYSIEYGCDSELILRVEGALV